MGGKIISMVESKEVENWREGSVRSFKRSGSSVLSVSPEESQETKAYASDIQVLGTRDNIRAR